MRRIRETVTLLVFAYVNVTVNILCADFTVLHSFSGSDGSQPQSTLAISGTTLFGTTSTGGSPSSSGYGTVFRVNADGSGFETLHTFPGPPTNGFFPKAGVTLSGTALYGTTSAVPGEVFRLNTDGTGFSTLHAFGGSDGSAPQADLLIDGAVIYGTTLSGGANNTGAVFRMNTDGTGFSVLHSFPAALDSSDGRSPQARLLLVGTALYGTTSDGGVSSGNGTLFKMQTDGTGFSVLHTFHNSIDDGAHPYGGLVSDGTTLYGTTFDGGAGSAFSGNNSGTIYQINLDGSDFSLLHSFSAVPSEHDGSNPRSALTLVGSTLFGTTYSGGSGAGGTVFQIETDGTGYSILQSLNAFGKGDTSTGSEPYAGLTFADNMLFGTTNSGGMNPPNPGAGDVFALAVPEPCGFSISVLMFAFAIPIARGCRRSRS